MEEEILQGIMVYNRSLYSEEYQKQLDLYIEAGDSLGINLTQVANDELLLGVKKHDLSIAHDFGEFDFGLFLDKDVAFASHLQELGLPIFNSADCIAVCDNKIFTMQRLAGQGIPMPDTVFAPIQFRALDGENRRIFLESVVGEIGLPMVVKEAYGSFGQQVYLAEDWAELLVIYEKVCGKPHLYQKFIASSRGQDVRLYIVGGGCVGAMGRYNIRDFRANISSGGGILPYRPSHEVIALAVKASLSVGATFSGVDILFGKHGEPILCEVNSSAHIKNFQDYFGQNLAVPILAEVRRLVLEG